MVKFKDDVSELKILENIKLIRLKFVTEDIIAFVLQSEEELDHSNPSKIYICDPAKVLYMQPTPQGASMGLIEWVPFRLSDDDGFELHVDDILFLADVNPAMKDMYMEYIMKIQSFHRVKKRTIPKPAFIANTSEQQAGSIQNLAAGEGLRARDVTDADIQEKVLNGTFVLPKKKTIN